MLMIQCVEMEFAMMCRVRHDKIESKEYLRLIADQKDENKLIRQKYFPYMTQRAVDGFMALFRVELATTDQEGSRRAKPYTIEEFLEASGVAIGRSSHTARKDVYNILVDLGYVEAINWKGFRHKHVRTTRKGRDALMSYLDEETCSNASFYYYVLFKSGVLEREPSVESEKAK